MVPDTARDCPSGSTVGAGSLAGAADAWEPLVSTAVTARTATDLAALVRAGELDPVAVTRDHLARIAARDVTVDAFEVVLADDALAEAAALAERDDLAELPLAGVPVAIKDVVDVVGAPTRHGSDATSPDPVDTDDTTVARLRRAGAIVVGKTRGPELSIWPMSDNVRGNARNPWNLRHVSGGSSGGSAAAVAAGMVPIALGSDGLGSIRIPSAACGVFGIKPGSGVVPIEVAGRDEHWFGMSQYGPLATTVADAALMLDVLAGRSPTPVHEPDRTLRVAVSVNSPAAGVVVGREQRLAAARAARALRRAGHQVVRDEVPYRPADTMAITARWLQGVTRDVRDFGLDPDALLPRTRTHARLGEWMARRWPVDDAQAEAFRARLEPFFAAHDVLLTPTVARRPPRSHAWHRRSWASNLFAALNYAPFPSPWNLADVPAASVPAGLDRHGLPLAVQIVAPHGREDLVLSVAAQLERLEPWQRLAPMT